MPPQQDQCIFCQLIENPQQLNLVGETDNFYAWLDINPRAKGHTMIVPKEHKETIMDLSPGEYQEAMKLTREVMEKAEKGLGADGVSVTMNVKEAGGQMIPHAYIQVFPRFQDEENAGTPTGAIFPQREELADEIPDITEEMNSVSVDFAKKVPEKHPESQRFEESVDTSENEETEEDGSESGERSMERNRKQRSGSLSWE